jgi:hypothetical protein
MVYAEWQALGAQLICSCDTCFYDQEVTFELWASSQSAYHEAIERINPILSGFPSRQRSSFLTISLEKVSSRVDLWLTGDGDSFGRQFFTAL